MLINNKFPGSLAAVVTVAGYFLLAAALFAGETSITGYAAPEARFFLNSATLEGQDNEAPFSFVLQPEFRWQSEGGDDQVTLIPFGRVDSVDDERTHADLREAYWRHTADDWAFEIGLNKVFWGVAESRHLTFSMPHRG